MLCYVLYYFFNLLNLLFSISYISLLLIIFSPTPMVSHRDPRGWENQFCYNLILFLLHRHFMCSSNSLLNSFLFFKRNSFCSLIGRFLKSLNMHFFSSFPLGHFTVTSSFIKSLVLRNSL